MTFIPLQPTRQVPGYGPKDAKIAIIGDFTTAYDDGAMRPFQGAAGGILEKCLHAAGLIRGEIYATNLFKARPAFRKTVDKRAGPAPEWFHESRGVITADGQYWVDVLREELEGVSANVFVACGKAAAVALGGLRKVSEYRGYVFETSLFKQPRKLILTHHPASAVRGNYTYAHMITCDLQKAKVESAFPEVVRPERNLILSYSNVHELVDWADYLFKCPELSLDIEVVNYEVASVQFSPRPDLGVVFPLGATVFQPNGWTEDEELVVWRQVQRLCGNPESVKILQNAIFDIQFMLSNIGIEVKGEVHDTMIGHSCAWPELPKGLGFLGSLYCGSQAYWKDKVNFDDIKGES